MNGREAERRDDEGLEVYRPTANVEVHLAHARRLVAESSAQVDRRGGRMSLAARTELANLQRTVSLCEEILHLRTALATALAALPSHDVATTEST